MDVATDSRGQGGPSPVGAPARPPEPSAEPGISRRLPPAITAAGGLLTAIGGLGTWIRATALQGGTGLPEQVATVAGTSQAAGWVVSVLGLAAGIAALGWLARTLSLRVLAATVSLSVVVVVTVRLASIDGRAAEMAEAATSRADVDAFHAGFGWGAWLLLIGAVLLALGLLAGGLRELDLRRTT